MEIRRGAALTLFWVKTPAADAGTEEYMTATSRLSAFFIAAQAVPAKKPAAVVTPPFMNSKFLSSNLTHLQLKAKT
jgi:hypothetical protein